MLETPTSTPLGAWSPFAEMRRLQSEMNRLFDGAGAQQAIRAFPPVNLWLGDNSVVVTAELPGLTHEDVELTVQENTLAIRGERKAASEDGGIAWHRRERASGRFGRTVQLPFRVDPDKVEARFANGVLAVEMQRPAEDRPRKIAINAA